MSLEQEARWYAQRVLDDSKRKRVYVLCGNESVETCYERAMQTIAWGCEPHLQFEMPLDALSYDDETLWDESFVDAYRDRGWTLQLGRDFCRYFNRWVWKQVPINEYVARGDERPFRSLAA